MPDSLPTGSIPLSVPKPENVLPRVQSRLAMIGEDEPCKPLWMSICNAQCPALADDRHGRCWPR